MLATILLLFVRKSLGGDGEVLFFLNFRDGQVVLIGCRGHYVILFFDCKLLENRIGYVLVRPKLFKANSLVGLYQNLRYFIPRHCLRFDSCNDPLISWLYS
jgi:hypothetical protein